MRASSSPTFVTIAACTGYAWVFARVRVGLGWVGLGWVGLGWVGLGTNFHQREFLHSESFSNRLVVQSVEAPAETGSSRFAFRVIEGVHQDTRQLIMLELFVVSWPY